MRNKCEDSSEPQGNLLRKRQQKEGVIVSREAIVIVGLENAGRALLDRKHCRTRKSQRRST